MLFLALWEYRAAAKTSTGVTPFQLVYSLEVILPIQCGIQSLKLAIKLLPTTSTKEKLFLYLAQLDETHPDAALATKTNKK